MKWLKKPGGVPDVAYRLLAWPDLPDAYRTAKVLQALARMEHGPMSLAAFMERTRLPQHAALALLQHLSFNGFVEATTEVTPQELTDSGFDETVPGMPPAVGQDVGELRRCIAGSIGNLRQAVAFERRWAATIPADFDPLPTVPSTLH